MTTYDLERSFGYLLHETARLFGKRFDQRARALGLTRAQCQVLAHLVRNEGTNQARLAEFMELEPISLARLIDRMEQAGWVERRADPSDRRAHLLFITDKAKPMFDEIFAIGQETRADAFAGLSGQDREQLIDLLLQVRRNLSKAGAVVAEGEGEGEGGAPRSAAGGGRS